MTPNVLSSKYQRNPVNVIIHYDGWNILQHNRKNFNLKPSTLNNVNNAYCCRDLSNNNFGGPVDFYGFNVSSVFIPFL